MKKLIPYLRNHLILCASLSMYISAHAQEWEILTVGMGAKPSIAIDTNDVPHIAFMLETQPGYVKHAMLEGDAFTESLVHEAYYYGPLDITISALTNYPAIAVHNHNDEDEDVYVRDIVLR